MASITELTCPLCSSAAHIKFNYRDFCKHLRLFHFHLLGLNFLVELMDVREVIPTCKAIRIMYQMYITGQRMKD